MWSAITWGESEYFAIASLPGYAADAILTHA